MANALFRGKLDPDSDLVVVVMAGGSGTRFWPLSRQAKPKQFLDIVDGEKSLIQLTWDRIKALPFKTSVLVASGESHIDLVSQHLPESGIVAEPCARNTAACVAYAAMRIESEVGPKAMLCLPADHIIQNLERFEEVISCALEKINSSDVLATIGLKPTKPETGYGYIKCGDEVTGASKLPVFNVDRFVEKPDLKTAESYLQSGEYFWNSGMFIWRTDVLLSSLKQYFPDLHQGLELMFKVDGDALEKSIRVSFPKLPSESIDTGLMEKAENVVMVPAEGLEWSDVGAWDAWAESASDEIRDKDGNVCSGDVKLIDSKACSVYSQSRLIAGVGLENLIIVDTGDALLVMPSDRAQDVKKVIAELQEEGKTKLL